MTTKLITGTGLQLLRRYDKKAESYKAQLLDDVTFHFSIIPNLNQNIYFYFSVYSTRLKQSLRMEFMHLLQNSIP